MPPAAGFDARHRDRQRRLGSNENRQVDDAVLFRPDELFAVDDEHRFLAAVENPQLRDTARLRDFGDAHRPVANRFVERDIRALTLGGSDEREHREIVNRHWVLEGERSD